MKDKLLHDSDLKLVYGTHVYKLLIKIIYKFCFSIYILLILKLQNANPQLNKIYL